MGERGPVPKRSTERRRRNADSKVETVVIPALGPPTSKVEPPKVSSRWHPMAKDWFNSLSESGQSQFFEPSDWQAARYVAEVMSRNLRQQAKFSSVLFQVVWSAMSDLLTTEGARRRVRMEIERGVEPETPAGVTAIADYRKRLKPAG